MRLSRREFMKGAGGAGFGLGLVLLLPGERASGAAAANWAAVPIDEGEIGTRFGEITYGVVDGSAFDSELLGIEDELSESGESGALVSGVVVESDWGIMAPADKGNYLTLEIPGEGGSQTVRVPLLQWNSPTTEFRVYRRGETGYTYTAFYDPQEMAPFLKVGGKIVVVIPFASPTTDLAWIGDPSVPEGTTGPAHILIMPF